jgi:hypothetical protein
VGTTDSRARLRPGSKIETFFVVTDDSLSRLAADGREAGELVRLVAQWRHLHMKKWSNLFSTWIDQARTYFESGKKLIPSI